jgi:hypothetical protein
VIPQGLLDIEDKERSNLFPWRGQFSPELVEALLAEYGSRGFRVFDPFAGVGTTLFEAAKQGMESVGTELNPSAFAMASTLKFLSTSTESRSRYIQQVHELLDSLVMLGPLFSGSKNDYRSADQIVAELAMDPALAQSVRLMLVNILIRGMSGERNFQRAFEEYRRLVLELPFTEKKHCIFHCDARKTGLPPQSVDLVITSPPYINVFNYHQNNRPAMEMLGWDLLHVAQSEFGANRKHRGNRFMTVTQYCLDMHEALIELRRVMTLGGRAIIIVGRESSVRGVSFGNAALVASLGGLAGFKLCMRQERKFKNRFGQIIFEDILHMEPSTPSLSETPQDIAASELRKKLQNGLASDVQSDIEDALQNVSFVKSSPLYLPPTNDPWGCSPSLLW